jgi:hypothetical protein
MQRLGEIAALNQIGKSLQEFTNVDSGAMQIEKPLRENADGNNAASQDRPHQQTALLDVIDHAKGFSAFLSWSQNKTVILIDPWHGRWLKVEESGLEWINNPLTAYGHAAFLATLRRRVPSFY